MFDVKLLQPTKVIWPVIEFDVEPLVKQLKEELTKYDGMTFEASDIKELKAVITELNNAEKLIEQYRKDTKKAVEAPIKEFEEKMKLLKIEVVQTRSEFKDVFDEFEKARRDEREKEVKELTKMIIDDSDLFEPFIVQVPFKKEYFNKSMTMAKIENDILSEVERLSMIQEVRNNKIEKIEDKCAILGYQMKVDIQSAGYAAMVDDKEVDVIIKLIEDFADSEVVRLADEAVPEVIEEVVEPDPVVPEPVKKEVEIFTEAWTLTGSEANLLRVETLCKELGVKVVIGK